VDAARGQGGVEGRQAGRGLGLPALLRLFPARRAPAEPPGAGAQPRRARGIFESDRRLRPRDRGAAAAPPRRGAGQRLHGVCRRRGGGQLRPAPAAEPRARGAQHLDGRGQRQRHSQLRPEPQAASHAAAREGPRDDGPRSRLRARLQGRRRGRDGQGARHRGRLSDVRRTPAARGHRNAREALQKGPGRAHRHRQRNRLARDGGHGGRAHQNARRRGAVHDRERGGRLRVFGVQTRGGGIPAVRRQPALGRVDREAPAGPAGGAREDRPQGHRRWAVSARHARKTDGRDAGRRRRGLRERGRRRSQHGLRAASAPGVRADGRDGQKHRGLP